MGLYRMKWGKTVDGIWHSSGTKYVLGVEIYLNPRMFL